MSDHRHIRVPEDGAPRRETLEQLIIGYTLREIIKSPQAMDDIIITAMNILLPFLEILISPDSPHPQASLIRREFTQNLASAWNAYFPNIPNPFTFTERAESISETLRRFFKQFSPGSEYVQRLREIYQLPTIASKEDIEAVVASKVYRILFVVTLKILYRYGGV